MPTDQFRVYLVDPSLDARQNNSFVIPLGAGLVAAYLRKHVPQIEVEVFKGSTACVEAIRERSPNVIGFTNYMWNTNLCVTIASYARELSNDTLLVFGGPEIDSDPFELSEFAKKYRVVDMFVRDEGEVAFLKIVQKYMELEEDTKGLRDSIDELGNSFYINDAGALMHGPQLPRITNLDEIPSPYLNGMFDTLLEGGVYLPMIQTNRGCPFACTFCQEGEDYFTAVRRHSLEFTAKELDYIADRVNPDNGLFITDSNWAMYKEDVDVAKHLATIQERVGWPREIISSTGKANLRRIIEVGKILNGAMFISNSVQSMSGAVLKAVRRRNISGAEMEENRSELEGMRQEPELIVPLPKETRESFLAGIDQLLDAGTPQRFAVFQTLILSNTPLADHGCISEHGMEIKYKQNACIMGYVKDRFVCATERVVMSTATMSSDDLCNTLTYAMVLDALLRSEPVPEIFYYLDSRGLKRSRLTRQMLNTIDKASEDVQACIQEFREDFLGEMFDTEEEVLEYTERHYEDYVSGRKGGGNLRYANKLWIDDFNGMMEWLFNALREVLNASGEQEPELQGELDSLKAYLMHVYQDRANHDLDSPETIRGVFPYDVRSWAETQGKQAFGNFRGATEYAFGKTSLSDVSDLSILKSLGFCREEGEEYLEVRDTRLYLVKLRRNVERICGRRATLVPEEASLNTMVGKLPLPN
jgi:hypothetical protein